MTLSRSGSPNAPQDPSEILAVATFHIRRIAAMTIRQHPERHQRRSSLPTVVMRLGGVSEIWYLSLP